MKQANELKRTSTQSNKIRPSTLFSAREVANEEQKQVSPLKNALSDREVGIDITVEKDQGMSINVLSINELRVSRSSDLAKAIPEKMKKQTHTTCCQSVVCLSCIVEAKSHPVIGRAPEPFISDYHTAESNMGRTVDIRKEFD